MKNNVLLNSRLGAYTALACSFAAVQQADAQMVYTDVDPDVLVNSGDVYMFDLDNDGTDDFGFTNVLYSGIGAMNALIEASGGVAGYIGSFFGSTFPFVSVLDEGQVVDNALGWYSTSGGAPLLWGTFAVVGSLGPWNNITDKYVGLRFKIGADFHYGWARIDVSHTAITLKDFAYNATANASLSTDGDVAIQEEENDFIPTTYAIDGGIHVSLPAGQHTASVSVYDLSGKRIYSEIISDRADILFKQYAKGIYLIEIENGDAQFSTLIGLK